MYKQAERCKGRQEDVQTGRKVNRNLGRRTGSQEEVQAGRKMNSQSGRCIRQAER
jgi:hypothetical protein